MDERASRRQLISTEDTETVEKEETVAQEEIMAWQPVTHSDDTLPTVLGPVNKKCV